jgi:tetratricopeptide (TPR) repeat protein
VPAPPRRAPAPRTSSSAPGPTRRFPRGSRRFPGSLVVFLLAASVLSWLGACASNDADVAPRRRAAAPPNAFLLPPTDGWDGTLDAAQRAGIASGFAALERDDDPGAALAAADAILAQSPDFPPALVLAAQAELSKGSPADARPLLEPWIERYPDYRAARLLWARVLDLEGDAAAAHAEYRALADQLQIAAARARATLEPALAAAQAALADALADRRIEEARTWADRIADWESPDAPVALEARLAVARAAGDQPAELELLRALHQRGHSDRALLERLVALELELGDADEALRLLEGLVAESPDDPSLRSQLAAAQLRFRLRLLPENVQKVATRGEIARGDFAALLYWVVPGVRQTQGRGAKIASDVLDHRWQQEIIRVLNRDLMRMNPVLHRFEPDRPITRLEALQSAIAVAAARPGGECAQDAAANPRPGPELVCGAATRCGLIDDAAECLPQAKVSGGEALGILGRALSLQKSE